jgi:hypothetical protein
VDVGIELEYQGLPEGCGLVELVQKLALHDLDRAAAVQFVPFKLRHGYHWRGRVFHPAPGHEDDYNDLDDKVFWDWCCMAAGRFPGIADRQLCIGKDWGRLHFLLSAKYRAAYRWPRPAPIDPRSWNDPVQVFDHIIEQAFQKAPPIAPDVVASQGIPVRLIPATVVADVGPCVAALEFEEVAAYAGEFITLKGWDHKWEFEAIKQLFEEFKTFFAVAAGKGESVMAVYH